MAGFGNSLGSDKVGDALEVFGAVAAEDDDDGLVSVSLLACKILLR